MRPFQGLEQRRKMAAERRARESGTWRVTKADGRTAAEHADERAAAEGDLQPGAQSA